MADTAPQSQPAIFLDRDGVINRNRDDYVKSWEEFVFLPGALAALRRLADLPWPILVVTNQSGVGRGIIPIGQVHAIHDNMRRAIQSHGGRIDGVFVCPHHPDDHCDCRKPAPGLLLQAQSRFKLDLTRSFLVGDSAGDILAAQQVGCRPFLVMTGRGPAQLPLLERTGVGNYQVVADLSVAVERILQEANLAPRLDRRP